MDGEVRPCLYYGIELMIEMNAMKLRDMSEEAILAEALRAVPDYRERIRGTGNFVLEDCVHVAMRRIENLFRADRGLRSSQPLDKNNRGQLEALLGYFRPKVIEAVSPVQLRYMQQRMVSNISATTARSLIPAAFAREDLTAEVEGQRHRAKVEVKLSPSLRVKFYVRYRDLNTKEGFSDEVVRAVLDLKNAADRLGIGVTLTRR